MLIGSGITKAFTGQPVFENIDFKLGANRKVALVGKNGCGKSTLLKVITGELTANAGNVQTDNEAIGYIPQELIFPDIKVGEYLEKSLENNWEFYKVDSILTRLDFANFDKGQKINTLSEGQKMKLKMLEVLLMDPTTLLIDEPTNHLDIEGILWFEQYIKHLDKAVLMISHDRQFLNNTVDEIWEIENQKLLKFVGNYDNYKKEKLQLVDKWNEEYVRFLKKTEQLENLLVRARVKRVSRKGGTGQIKSRIKREIDDNKVEKYVDQKMSDLKFETGITHSKLMVGFNNVTKAYGDSVVFENMSFDIRGGEKVWLFGQNGGGKTTIVKLITGDEAPTDGVVKVGENMKVGYFAQKQTSLNFEKNLLEYFIAETGCYYEDAFGKLKKFMFEQDDLKKRVGNLSPGQRARFAFALFAYKNYDMLVLDEPDNHLDIDTKEVLERSLSEYKGTLLLISHDRFFVERAGVEKVLNLKEGRLIEF